MMDSYFKVSGLPSRGFDPAEIFEFIGRENFALIYDLKNSVSVLGMSDGNANDIIKQVTNGIPGVEFKESDGNFLSNNGYSVFSIYRKIEEFGNKLFYDIFDVLPRGGFIAILFVNTSVEEAGSTKKHLENLLSSKNIRESESSLKSILSRRVNSTSQRDLYYDSEEKLMLGLAIESLNKAILSNGLTYKIFFMVPKNYPQISDYISKRFLVLSEYELDKKDFKAAVEFLGTKPSIPFGTDYLKEFINFYGFHNPNHTLHTYMPVLNDGIPIGKFVKEGVSETDIDVRIDPSSINLGFIITGLPGSGKTREVMAIIDSLLGSYSDRKPAIFVITPSREWEDFALFHEMFFIKLYQDNAPINFFRCPQVMGGEKFYGNLAMILSAAANAGPYRNPMEKCMLNAFRRVYNGNDIPDPVIVYGEIEESIIRYHGKRMMGGEVKYTKHGENIKSALENLRGILAKPQYCVKNGIRIEDLADNGAIFDVSAASAGTRAQLYALILNQIYAITDRFDTDGDDELRLVICIEEAQLIFKDEDSPAVEDIKQRIQDFRKQGIGLILITHNVNDIDVGIRRLCQLKLYLKQASDTALIASRDLIFGNVEQEDVLLKLKTLSSRVGAFSCVSKNGKEKKQQDTVFISTDTYKQEGSSGGYNPLIGYLDRMNLIPATTINCRINLKPINYDTVKTRELKDYHDIKLSFLGEEVYNLKFAELPSYNLALLKDMDYRISVLNARGKILKQFHIRASPEIYLDFSNQ